MLRTAVNKIKQMWSVPCISSFLYVSYIISISMVECQRQTRLPRRQQENYGVGGRGPPQYGLRNQPNTIQTQYKQRPPNSGGLGGGGSKKKRRPSYNNNQQQNADEINDFSDILKGADFGILDYKAIIVGRVRQGLVDRLCDRTARLVINEGQTRFDETLEEVTFNVTNIVDERCQGLIPEIEDLCDDIVDEVVDRYNGAIQETLPELEEVCDDTKNETAAQVRNAANITFQMVFEVSKDLAEERYQRMVVEGRLQAEQMFADGLAKGRAQAEEMLAANITDGRKMAEEEFQKRVEEGKLEAEAELERRVQAGREEAEEMFKKAEKEGRAEAEAEFQKRVAEGEAAAQKMFDEMVTKGTQEGEERCGEMIITICKDVEPDSNSFDFCSEFCFFTGRDCDFLYDYDDEESYADDTDTQYDEQDDYEERIKKRRRFK